MIYFYVFLPLVHGHKNRCKYVQLQKYYFNESLKFISVFKLLVLNNNTVISYIILTFLLCDNNCENALSLNVLVFTINNLNSKHFGQKYNQERRGVKLPYYVSPSRNRIKLKVLTCQKRIYIRLVLGIYFVSPFTVFRFLYNTTISLRFTQQGCLVSGTKSFLLRLQ